MSVLLALVLSVSAQSQDLRPQVYEAARVNTSIPLRDMPSVPGLTRDYPQIVPNRLHDFLGYAAEDYEMDDPVIDNGSTALRGGATGSVDLNFEAMTADKSAAVAGRFAPPDTNGDIGPNHYVQWVNVAAEIYDRNGTSLLGPFAGNQFFVGLGGRCETTNSGDPIVLYDEHADRWLVSQFVVSQPFALCVAISTTPDPTGAYHQYEFNGFGANFPDYFKFGVWPDAYYATTRSFLNLAVYRGNEAVAFERDQMLVGAPAQMVVFLIPPGTGIDGWLPADLDGPPPPPGTPGIFGGRYAVGVQEIRLYELDVDWVTPGNSTLTSLATLTEAPYSFSTSNVIQPAPGESVHRLAHFTMFRLQYRNFGTHQTLVTNHTVDVAGRAAPRWYELRDSGGGWGIHQQGTYAPADAHSRWMGSAAMNGAGEIALGYSISSATMMPSIRFTGQTAGMSGSGIMDVPETEIQAGTGVQTATSSRWGDYSMMAVDPVGDEQFWFTQEYYGNTNSFDWKTRVAALSIDDGLSTLSVSCAAVSPPVVIPAEGGRYEFNLIVTNNGATPATFDIWYEITGAGSATKGPFVARTLEPGASLNRVVSINVPDIAPAGAYTHTCNVGTFPTVDDSDSFAFTKAAALVPGTESVAAWSTDAELEAALADAAVPSVPVEATLHPAYPNPFNPAATLSFTMPEAALARLVVYDAIGREVVRMVDGRLEAGRHEFFFDGSALPSGVYYARFTAGVNEVRTQRLTLLK